MAMNLGLLQMQVMSRPTTAPAPRAFQLQAMHKQLQAMSLPPAISVTREGHRVDFSPTAAGLARVDAQAQQANQIQSQAQAQSQPQRSGSSVSSEGECGN